MKALYITVALAPLAGALIAGLFGRRIGRAGAHWATILSVLVSFVGSCIVFDRRAERQQLQRQPLHLAHRGNDTPPSTSASRSTGCRR